MKEKSPHQFSQPIPNQSAVKTFKCGNSHVFKSQSSICPVCGETSFSMNQDSGSFHKALGAPDWRKSRG